MNIIYGRNTVWEAIEGNAENISKIYLQVCQRYDNRTQDIIAKAKQKQIPVQYANGQTLTELCKTDKHQGVCALSMSVRYTELNRILDMGVKSEGCMLLVVLDCIQDPHNMGAIMRTAECAGTNAVLVPKDNSAPLNATVHKTSAGAISHIPICRIGNVAQSICFLKKQGIWVVGAANEETATPYTSFDFCRHVAIVIGSEGKGLRPLVRRECDAIVKIPVMGKLSSLNASVAAGILFYEVLRQRQQK